MILRPRAALFALAVLVGCTDKQTTPVADNEHAKPDEQQPSGPEVIGPWVEPARTHLVVQRHAAKDPRASYLAIELGEAGPTALTAVEASALPNERWPEHYLAPAGHGGQARFVLASGEAEPWKLAVHEVGEVAPRVEVELAGAQPAALHLAGDQVYLGQANEVAFVDLAAPEPKRIVLHTQPDMAFKAYDLFVRTGDWLVAIDDVMVPVYADTFGLASRGPARHEQGWQLPETVNGHYYAGALARGEGPRDATLYNLIGYGILSGHGQMLQAVPVTNGKLGYTSGPGQPPPPTLREHVERGTGAAGRLIAGEAYSSWSALAHHRDATGERLLLCAGPRDLLVLPTDFNALATATPIAIAGDCLDLLVDGSRVFVLSEAAPTERPPAAEWTAPEATTLLELKLAFGETPTATVVHSLALPGHHRFLR